MANAAQRAQLFRLWIINVTQKMTKIYLKDVAKLIEDNLGRCVKATAKRFYARTAPGCGRQAFNETIVDGFELLPDALNMLFEGRNVGKLLVGCD